MAGDQQLHQLSIEQFVSQQDETQKGATDKFQAQLQGLNELAKGNTIPAIELDSRKHQNSAEEGLKAIEKGKLVPARPADQSAVLDFGTGDKQGIVDGDDKLAERMRKNGLDQQLDLEGKSLGEILKHFHGNDTYHDLLYRWPKEVTPEDRKEAKDALGKDVSPLINEADSKTLKSMQEAIVDGNIGKLAETLKNMPPERAKAFVKELNKELKAHHAGVELSATGDGRVFVYETSGQTAIQINRDGTTTLKPIRHNYDGSIVVEPGEIINKDPEEVMKGISDSAVRGITGGNRIIWDEKPEGPPPFFPRPKFPPIEEPRWPKDPIEWPPIEKPPIRWPKGEDPSWPIERPPIRWPKDPWSFKPVPKYELLDDLMKKPYWMKNGGNDSINFL